MLKVAVWGLAYFAIGGYSHHQARAVREDTLGTQVNPSTPCGKCPPDEPFPQVANIGRDLLGVLFTFTICSAIHFKVYSPLSKPNIQHLFSFTPWKLTDPHLQMIVAEYSNYIDPIMSMVYIAALVWTCVPLVR